MPSLDVAVRLTRLTGITALVVSIASGAFAQSLDAPPVYVMPRDGLLRPVPQKKEEAAQKELPKPPAKIVAMRPRPPLRPPGPTLPSPVPTPTPELPPAPPTVPAPAPARPPEVPTVPEVARPPAPPPEPPVAPEEPALSMAGEYRLAALVARRGADHAAGFGQQLNRVRLKADLRTTRALSFHLENDFDLTTGSYLRSAEFRDFRAGVDTPRQYWSGRIDGSGRRRYHLSSNVYRGFAKLSVGSTDITLGRQRVPLGTGLFWSTMDMLNPPNPLRIESDEVLGVDAVLVERKLGPLSKVSVVHAPDPDRRKSRWVAQYRRNIASSDVTLTYGKYWEDHLFGIDLATQVGNAGVRGEYAFTKPVIGPDFHKALIAWDYAWANTLALSFEAFYSSQPVANRLASAARHPQMRFAQPHGSSYAGLTAGYDLTPLWRVSAAVLGNLRDRSGMVYPSLAHSFSDNLSLLIGSQFFFGGADTEFGASGDMHFVRMQYHF